MEKKMSEKDIVKSATLTLNEEICCCLSNISQMINSLNVLPLKEAESEALKLKMECWDLLNSSKTTITTTKNMIDTLLDVCNEWNQILTDKNNGKLLKKEQIQFIPYIIEEFEKYFSNDLGLKTIQNKWYHFNKKAGKIRKKRIVSSEENSEKKQVSTKYIASLCLIGGGILTAIFSSDNRSENEQKEIEFDAGNNDYSSNLKIIGYIMIFIGIAVGFLAIKSTSKSKQKRGARNNNDDEEEEEKKEMNNLWIAIPVQPESPSNSNTISFNKIKAFFTVFMENIKEDNNNNNNNKYYDFQRIQSNISSIIKSFQGLQDFLQTIISTINAKQNALL